MLNFRYRLHFLPRFQDHQPSELQVAHFVTINGLLHHQNPIDIWLDLRQCLLSTNKKVEWGEKKKKIEYKASGKYITNMGNTNMFTLIQNNVQFYTAIKRLDRTKYT